MIALEIEKIINDVDLDDFINMVKLIDEGKYNVNNDFKYILSDSHGNTESVCYETYNKLITNKIARISAINIDNSIINAINCDKELGFISNMNKTSFENLAKKAQMTGMKYTKLNEHMVYIEQNNKIRLCSDIQLKIMYGKSLFECTKFKSIHFNNVDTSKCADMTSMFYGCNADLIDISNLNTSNTIYMDEMFCKCKAEIIGLCKLDTSKVIHMKSMFEYYENSKATIDVRNFVINDNTHVDNMFYECHALIYATDKRLQQ